MDNFTITNQNSCEYDRLPADTQMVQASRSFLYLIKCNCLRTNYNHVRPN
jgi:hypothetical protein